ncbi:DUF1876 domain-containing protein [Hoyosella sp. YIM 151337]|uniref:DUF1876 domain-containing protein n=1 Tax=Hoyosella sp. YIM 151337 TaxID=2992742 RepID=UPI0022355C7D|nr:DUF1876 domain-containing protein [Hoyosella sp. YIM 151337]MCW4355303.1 DUF1876 domain-containing protein [Hoyosella sp. YIM 151337]
MQDKHWSVDIVIDERDGQTRAEARLHADDGSRKLVATGLARKNPDDRDVPLIGDELAAARALADLSHQLIEQTATDIESVTHVPAHLTA